MALDRGLGVAGVLLAAWSAGCGSAPLATPHPVDAGVTPVTPEALAIPADVVPPVLRCAGDLGDLALATPCQLGEGPVFETDCALGASGQVLRFLLTASLPTLNGSFSSGPPLGQALPLRAIFAPPAAAISAGDVTHESASLTGSVTFVSGSLATRTLDGWFSHLDLVWSSPSGMVTCTLDDGRFTTVPGAYL